MKRLISAAAGLLFASQASAAIITFDNFVYNNPGTIEVDWFVTISQTSSSDPFSFDIGYNASTPDTADILGFGFNTTLAYANVPGSDITNTVVSLSSPGSGSTALSDCNGPCNWNGALNPAPTYSFQVGDQGSSGGQVTGLSFDLANPTGATLDENTFSLVAIRGQTAGPAPDGGQGSVKDYSSTGNGGGNPVPELDVAGLPLAASLLAGIIGIGLERRRKKFVA